MIRMERNAEKFSAWILFEFSKINNGVSTVWISHVYAYIDFSLLFY
jgi:hypothetical protein